ncbi:MAG: chromosomal replication initiation protein [uncultured bacterium]|nr:MAG: chromosomal replication initiation protein [uncultured bacterium]
MPITLDLAREVLRKIIIEAKPIMCVENIQSKVADYFSLKIADLKSKRRHRNLAVPRQIAMYLCKKHLTASFPELGNKFGGKDHTTVMHAVDKIKRCVSTDVTIRNDVEELEKMLGM